GGSQSCGPAPDAARQSQDQYGTAARMGAAGQPLDRKGSARPLGDHDLPGCPAPHRIEAPWLLEGPIDGKSFAIYVENVLLPTLRPGDIVILDHLSSHTRKLVRQLVRSAGAKLLFLPKYSPDLNPIEQVFAKLKHLLRKAAARTVETVCSAIGELLGTFTKDECVNYFRNSGYQPY